MTQSPPKVWLVGAGPGDEGLITVRGLECIKTADVLVYDRLVGEALLKHRKPDAECIYVGKSSEGHTMPQEEINQLLVRLAREGHTVVRLKGGDPFVFGRGGEEALELLAHGIPFEIVPGVTSAIAGPASAGIPVTHRGVAVSFTVVTGHEDPTKAESQVEWENLAVSSNTLVILMGVGNLPTIAERLIAGGRATDTPVGVIRYATRATEQVLTSTLANVAKDVADQGVKPPALIVVGEVVRLRDQLAQCGAAPLAGQRVLITRPAEQAGEFAELLRAEGAEPVTFPLIKIVPTEDTSLLREALDRLDTFDWLFFTSANGVRTAAPHLESVIAKAGGPDRLPVKVAAVGPRTAQVCREFGLDVAFMPTQYAVEAIVEQFPEDVGGQRMLLLRAHEANPALPEGLRAGGATVEEITLYRAEPADADAPRLRALLSDGEVDLVTLMSSSTARNLVGLLGDDAARILQDIRIACLGHVTARTFKDLTGRAPDVQAGVYTMAGLIQAVIQSQREVKP